MKIKINIDWNLNFKFKLNNKVNAFLHAIWNLITTALIITFAVIFLVVSIWKIKADFVVGQSTPIDYSYMLCMFLLMGVISTVTMIFTIINLFKVMKNNIALDERKALVMKHMHIATFVFAFLAGFSATVLSCDIMGLKIFVATIFVATIRELVYQAMLFVDNRNKDTNIKRNAICLAYSLIGLPICLISIVQIVSDLGLTPIIYESIDHHPFGINYYNFNTYLLNNKLIFCWLTIISCLLCTFLILSVFSILKIIKGKRKQNITE